MKGHGTGSNFAQISSMIKTVRETDVSGILAECNICLLTYSFHLPCRCWVQCSFMYISFWLIYQSYLYLSVVLPLFALSFLISFLESYLCSPLFQLSVSTFSFDICIEYQRCNNSTLFLDFVQSSLRNYFVQPLIFDGCFVFPTPAHLSCLMLVIKLEGISCSSEW